MMAGIVGIARPGQWRLVRDMLAKVKHRGGRAEVVVEHPRATLGQTTSGPHHMWLGRTPDCAAVCDGAIFNWRVLSPETLDVDAAMENLYAECGPNFLNRLIGPFALAIAAEDGLFLARDCIGVSPLYLGSRDANLCFASEVKALAGWCRDIKEFPPGTYYHPQQGFVRFGHCGIREEATADPDQSAAELRRLLSRAIARRIAMSRSVGCWLSGGLDSSAVAALANQQLDRLETFAVGLAGASDLAHARVAAEALGTKHHERRVSEQEVLDALPSVIYHLESFDALLVRSSVLNYLLAGATAERVDSVFSGEGGDEVLAGYDYLKELDPGVLPYELVDITNRLHNTALQRVDRCASAFGLMAHTPFLDGHVVDHALAIPARYKIRRNERVVGKWILRKALDGLLPDSVLRRGKAGFSEGGGIAGLLARRADKIIADSDFAAERRLPGGDTLDTKEELLYYRIFREHFGEMPDLSFVGRTKNAPRADVRSVPQLRAADVPAPA